jgi:hypothetical protein
MSFVKLDDAHQKQADALYEVEKTIINLIDALELTGKHRWISIGRTDIEKGFMALRKGITERCREEQKDSCPGLAANSPWDPR